MALRSTAGTRLHRRLRPSSLATLVQGATSRSDLRSAATAPKLHRVGGVAIVIALGIASLWIIVARGGFSGARFTITVRGDGPSGVRIDGTVPGHTTPDVASFIAELELPRGARVQGIPDGERITLRFSPTVPERLHQRMRNFFYLKW